MIPLAFLLFFSIEYSKGLGPIFDYLKKSNFEPKPKEVDLGLATELLSKKSIVYLDFGICTWASDQETDLI